MDDAAGYNVHRLTPGPDGTSSALPFTVFGDIDVSVCKPWILKGVIAKGETSSWIAPPGKGKSALLTDIAVHCAAGSVWRGHKAKAGCGVVFFAFERADLTRRRLAAYKSRYGLEDLPIAVVGVLINIMAPACVDAMVGTIRAAEACFRIGVGLIVVDTFAKGIAAGGGDEDKAKDQGAALANLRRVQELTGVHVAIIGHTGKDEGRGARGSSAHLGDVDVMVQIRGDDVKTAEIIKANDQAEGALTSFRLTVHDFGVDEDGDQITTSILAPEIISADASPAPKRALPNSAQVALRALREAVTEAGEVPPASNHIPPGTPAVSIDIWRQYAYRMGISGSDEERAKQTAFKRAFDTLVALKRVGVWDPLTWPTD